MRHGGALAAAALTAVVVACSACGGGGGVARGGGPVGARPGTAARSGWSSQRELRWLRDYGVWQDQIADYATRAAASPDVASLTALANCGQLLDNDVGPAPTARLRHVASLLHDACADWRQAGLAVIKGRGAPAASIRARVRRASRTMTLANTLLPPGEDQPLPKGAPSAAQSRIVPLLSRVATRLAGRRAEVRCWTRRDWARLIREEREVSVSRVDARAAGLTSIASGRENLRPSICARLDRLAHGHVAGGRGELEDAFALLVFAHESQHASGIASEVLADCRGMQTMRRGGVLLGLPSAAAQRLANDYWRMYPEQPKIYVSSECRNGGRLDMRPHDATWP